VATLNWPVPECIALYGYSMQSSGSEFPQRNDSIYQHWKHFWPHMFLPPNQELARAWKFPAPRSSAGFSRLTQKIWTECKYFSNPNILPMQIKVLRKSKEDLQAESKRELETTRAGTQCLYSYPSFPHIPPFHKCTDPDTDIHIVT